MAAAERKGESDRRPLLGGSAGQSTAGLLDRGMRSPGAGGRRDGESDVKGGFGRGDDDEDTPPGPGLLRATSFLQQEMSATDDDDPEARRRELEEDIAQDELERSLGPLNVKFQQLLEVPVVKLVDDGQQHVFDYSGLLSQLMEEESAPPNVDWAAPIDWTKDQTIYDEKLEEERERMPFEAFLPVTLTIPKVRSIEAYDINHRLTHCMSLPPPPPAASPHQYAHILVLSVDHVHEHVPKHVFKSLGDMISVCANLEVLAVVSSQLTSAMVSRIMLPRLLTCDLSDNFLKDIQPMIDFVYQSPLLAELNLVGNPLCNCASWNAESSPFPLPKAKAWKIIASAPYLKKVNGANLPLIDHQAVVQSLGSPQEQVVFAQRAWSELLTGLPAHRVLPSWDPAQIVEVVLPGNRLDTFEVGGLVNLRVLDLHGMVARRMHLCYNQRRPDNRIENIATGGLHSCIRLQKLMLAQNRVLHLPEVSYLRFVPSLQELTLHDNPIVTAYKDLRLFIIYHLRRARGIPKRSGLLRLDDQMVSLDERIASMKLFERADQDAVDRYRWQLAMESVYGQRIMNSGAITKQFIENLRVLQVPGSGLHVIDLSASPLLEHVNLRFNFLTLVGGIKCLTTLRSFDVRDNPKLRVKATVQDLVEMPSVVLDNVSLAPNDLVGQSSEHLFYVLGALMPRHKSLRLVEGLFIAPSWRCHVWTNIAGTLAEKDVPDYRLHLSMLMTSVPQFKRWYDPRSVKPGVLYNPANVTSLLWLQGLRRTEFPDLSRFCALQQLNLACNRLRTLDDMGLVYLTALVVLDLHGNELQVPMTAFSELFDKLPNLSVTAVRDNPCVDTDLGVNIVHILTFMPRARRVNCSLKVIDREIAVSERIEAWVRAGGEYSEVVDKLRADIALSMHAPPGIPFSEILHLDLDDQSLSHMDLSGFGHLQKLRLRKNRLTSLEQIGIGALCRLQVLDVRDNLLALTDVSMPATLACLAGLTKLQYLGLNGNHTSMGMVPSTSPAGQDFRIAALSLLPFIRNIDCPLVFMDDKEVDVNELVSAVTRAMGTVSPQFEAQLVAKGRPVCGEVVSSNNSLPEFRSMRREPPKRLASVRNVGFDLASAQSSLDLFAGPLAALGNGARA